MSERRSRPVISATVSREAFEHVETLRENTNFNKSVFIDKLILTHKRATNGKGTK